MISKLAKCFIILLLVIPIVPAQTTTTETSPAEKKKAQVEREKKTLALVDEITKELQSLKLPENRIRIEIGLAGALWPRDEKRARLLFKEAAASLSEIAAAIENGDQEDADQDGLAQQLRNEMVQMAAAHDPRLAVDFLRATRTESTSRPPNSGLTNLEAQLEMRVAIQIAAKDPSEALRVAQDSLKISLDYESLNLLYSLQSQQKTVAEKFLDDILNAIRTYGIGNSSATPIAMNLLRTWIENNRAAKDPAAQRTTTRLSLSNLDERTARELCNMIVNAVLSDAPANDGLATSFVADGRRHFVGRASLYPGMIHGMLQQLKPILPDIEALAPDRIGALRARVTETEKTFETQQGPWVQYQELAQNGTPEALMEAARTAPIEMASGLIQQAGWKAINNGDDENARQIIEKIDNPRQRAEMGTQLVRQRISRAREQKKLGEARALLSRLPLEEQVTSLVELAEASVTAGDKPSAFQLLGEAQALLADRALNYPQLQAQMRVANAYAHLDAARGTSIVEGVIDHVNELVEAARVLNGFDVQGYFRSGEFVIKSDNPLSAIAQECGQALATSARENLDQGRTAAERFQRSELRLIALLQIVQAALEIDAK
jgi:hypothetical protein